MKTRVCTYLINFLHVFFLQARLQVYKEKEIQLRKNLMDKAFRGKFDFTLTIESDKGDDEYGLNKALFKKYYQEIQELKSELGIDSGDIIQAILRIPNVVGAVNEEVDEEEWKFVLKTSDEAIEALNKFRAEEGKATEKERKRIAKYRCRLFLTSWTIQQ